MSRHVCGLGLEHRIVEHSPAGGNASVPVTTTSSLVSASLPGGTINPANPTVVSTASGDGTGTAATGLPVDPILNVPAAVGVPLAHSADDVPEASASSDVAPKKTTRRKKKHTSLDSRYSFRLQGEPGQYEER